jgi:enterochelin esterase family protein
VPRVVVALTALTLLTPIAGPAQQGPVDGRVASPTLAAVSAGLERGDQEALRAFWLEVERRGTPLIDPDPEAPGYSTVTFVAKGGPGIQRVRVDSNLSVLLVPDGSFDLPPDLGWMTRLDGSDIWYLSLRLRNDVRIPYRLEIQGDGLDPTPRPDPLNPEVWEPGVPALAASILELPGAPPQPWRNPSGNEGEGDWDQLPLGDPSRDVYVYRPLAWELQRTEPYPVLIGLEGFGHGIGMRVDRMVDELIGAGRLAPMVVALVDDILPSDEETRYEATGDFVVDDLLPALREEYRVSSDPAKVVISGTSRRGMMAALMAFRHPESFGNVLSLSGSYYWRPQDETEPEWVPRTYAAGDRRPVRFYMAAGELETFVTQGNQGHYLLATNRHMRDVLRARGYMVEYIEFNGVHSELNWQDWLADGLIRLVGP